jgi:hypothetical protein
VSEQSTRETATNPLITMLTTPAPANPDGSLADIVTRVDAAAHPAAPPTAHFKAEMNNYIAGGGDLTMDLDGMLDCIAFCDSHIDDLRKLRRKAYTDLYVEHLGIGEDGFPPARDLLTKYQEKARGGGRMPQHSSAVGYFQSLIEWVTDYRDGLRAALDAYAKTDAAAQDAVRSIDIKS